MRWWKSIADANAFYLGEDRDCDETEHKIWPGMFVCSCGARIEGVNHP